MSGQQGLARSLGLYDAVYLGLGSILGTGAFVALGLAAGLAGWWALPALGLATLVAAMNALSSAQLAAAHPVSGGSYAYGYRYLSPSLGFLAGTTFLAAKSASAAAAGIGIAAYCFAAAGLETPPFAGAVPVLLMTALVAAGLRSAALVNRLLVSIALLALIILPVAALLGSGGGRQETSDFAANLPRLPEAAALIFVAFTGYGRIATLGEEAREPRRTIPRAIIIALLLTACLYAALLWTGLAVLGPAAFGGPADETGAPLERLAEAVGGGWLAGFVSFAALCAMAGVLLNLILGLSRMGFAMARQGDLPERLGVLNTRREPVAAVIAVGLLASLIAAAGNFEGIWSFSAFTVLVYYSVANLAALRLSEPDRLYPRLVSWAGLAGCLGLAFWVSPGAWLSGLCLIAAGFAFRAVFGRRSPRGTRSD